MPLNEEVVKIDMESWLKEVNPDWLSKDTKYWKKLYARVRLEVKCPEGYKDSVSYVEYLRYQIRLEANKQRQQQQQVTSS